MEDYVIKYFIDYCGNDNEKILNELEKLKCYKMKEIFYKNHLYIYTNQNITYDDIDSVVLKSFNDNIFSLIDAIMNKNKKKAIVLIKKIKNLFKNNTFFLFLHYFFLIFEYSDHLYKSVRQEYQ